MKLLITTSADNIEMANFLLGQAYQSAIKNPDFLKAFDVSKEELLRAEKFRKQLLNAYTNGRISADIEEDKIPSTQIEGEIKINHGK